MYAQYVINGEKRNEKKPQPTLFRTISVCTRVLQATIHRVEFNNIIILYFTRHYLLIAFKRFLSRNKRPRMSNYRGRASFPGSPW